MGGWTDPSDENLQARLQTRAVHCPGLPWQPAVLNLLFFPDLTALRQKRNRVLQSCLSRIGVKPVLTELHYVPLAVCLKPFQVRSVPPATS